MDGDLPAVPQGVPDGPIPPMAIGSELWPGLAKLAEECAEVLQVIAKLAAYPSGEHPDGGGPLRFRLRDEMADVYAALDYVRAHNVLGGVETIELRRDRKFARFQRWDFEERQRVAGRSTAYPAPHG